MQYNSPGKGQGRVFYYAHPLIGDVYLECLGHNKLFVFLHERLMLMVMACGDDTEELKPVFMNCGGYTVDPDGHYQCHFFWLLACISCPNIVKIWGD